jgi:hypothetical protein
MEIDNSNDYWLYLISKTLWKEYEKYIKKNDKCYIGLLHKYDIKENDVLFLFCKDGVGFIGMIQLRTTLEKREHVKVFKNPIFNTFSAYIKELIFFDKCISFTEINKKLEDKLTTKKIRGADVLTLLDFEFGKVLAKTLLKINDIKEDSSDTISIESFSDDNLEKLEKNKKKNIKRRYKKEDNQDDEEDNQEYDEEDSGKENNSSNEYDDKKIKGNIPILIIPCRDFELPEGDDGEVIINNKTEDEILKCKYIKKHYKTCKDCDVTNNNNFDFNYIMNKFNKMYYYEIKATSYKYRDLKEAYQSMQGVFIDKDDEIEEDSLNIYNIIDENSYYNNCLFIHFYEKK